MSTKSIRNLISGVIWFAEITSKNRIFEMISADRMSKRKLIFDTFCTHLTKSINLELCVTRSEDKRHSSKYLASLCSFYTKCPLK